MDLLRKWARIKPFTEILGGTCVGGLKCYISSISSPTTYHVHIYHRDCEDCKLPFYSSQLDSHIVIVLRPDQFDVIET